MSLRIRGDGTEPVDDDEILCRKATANPQAGYYNQETKRLSPLAFKPGGEDDTGISLDRAKYRTAQQAAQGLGNSYYVALVRAGEVRACGMSVTPRPIEGNAGHVEIPEITFANKKETASLERQKLLAHELTYEVQGPFEKTTTKPLQ